ncbi:MAG: threonine/serine dehydratase [Pseudomonadota bacterium]|nr:threonine/serine dehydratase [Pseudomonadota bacterium]
MYPTINDVFKAKEVIAGIADNTPLIPSAFLSKISGVEVLLKLENMQPIGSFKIRGALNAVSKIRTNTSGVSCCSTGNHGRGIAFAAKSRGMRSVIFMSSLVPENKIESIRELGAEVRLTGNYSSDAELACTENSKKEGLLEVSPFDDPDVISGQGTIGLELITARPDLQTVILPLSGGGLAAGVALAIKSQNPDVEVIGVTMENGAAMHESLIAGKPVNVKEQASLADALGGDIGNNNRYTFEMCRKFLTKTITVSEKEIYKAMQALYFEDRIIAEGSCAVSVASLLSGKVANLKGPTAMIITGRNVNMSMFTRIIVGEDITLGKGLLAGQKYDNSL